MALPIITYLSIARICQYLAADDNSVKLIFKGGGNRPNQSLLINITRNIIQWLYDLDPTDPDIPKMSLYMYSLCNPYIAEAMVLLNQGQAGQVINPSTGTTVTITNPALQFTVGSPDSLMNEGDTVLVLEYENVINPSVEIFLDGVDLAYGVATDRIRYAVDYDNDNDLVTITFNEGVSNGQLYRIRFLQLINVGIPASLGN